MTGIIISYRKRLILQGLMKVQSLHLQQKAVRMYYSPVSHFQRRYSKKGRIHVCVQLCVLFSAIQRRLIKVH